LTDLPSDDEDACDYLVHHVKAQVEASRVGGVYCVGGATAGTAKALALLGLTTEVPLVAHDLTSTHQTMLVDGSLAFVLHQDVHYCVLTAARTLRGLCENIRGAPSVVQPRVEILTAENLH
jgi:LacI family transcriptional regulator